MKPPMKKKRAFQRRKVCVFCADSGMKIDYKDVKTLNHFVTLLAEVSFLAWPFLTGLIKVFSRSAAGHLPSPEEGGRLSLCGDLTLWRAI
jgi:ribosomal protein S18